MIIQWGMDLGIGILDLIYSFLGVLPSFSSDITAAIDTFFQFLFSAVGLVSIFVPLNMVKILVPMVIAIINMENIIRLIMFILKKIPVINIK